MYPAAPALQLQVLHRGGVTTMIIALMEAGTLVILVVALGAAFLIIQLLFNEEARLSRTLDRLPLVPIRDLDERTPARVVGEVVPLGPVVPSPLTGRPCVFHEVEVEERRTSGRSRVWRTVIHVAHGVDFAIRDATGEALVRLTEPPRTVLRQVAEFRSGAFQDPPAGFEEFLARHGRSATTFLGFNRRLRYVERILTAGQRVALTGRVRREPGARTAAAARPTMVIDGTDDIPLIISDDLPVSG